MGEIIWFYSLFAFLEKTNHTIIHCPNKTTFYKMVEKHTNVKIILDTVTLLETIQYIDLEHVYCMSYWQVIETPFNYNEKIEYTIYIDSLGFTSDFKSIDFNKILIPFKYSDINTYLGFNLDSLCSIINSNKYNNIGVIWGKTIDCINLELIRYLCKNGVEFYTVCNTNIEIDGVYNLGILINSEWHQLIHDAKFVLGSGLPKSGPTILESIYYKTPVIGLAKQFNPHISSSSNIYKINTLSDKEIFDLISSIEFKEEDPIYKEIISDSYEKRVNKIFNLS